LLSRFRRRAQPVAGIALIDTGATITCIDGGIAAQMSLAANGTAKICSASHDNTDCLTYPVRLHFPGWNVNLDSTKAMAVAIKKQGIIALVGRDLLQNCLLVYNGVDGAVSIAM
jgi:predicted aspartyl protease